MSKKDLIKAFEIIESNQDEADFEGNKSLALIQKAEQALRLTFPPTYVEFLSKYGCGDIAGYEFYGIISDDFINSSVPDAIWLTLDERRSANLPKDMVIIYSTGEGIYYALDCSKKGGSGEAPVVTWTQGKSSKEDQYIIAEDYGQFLLNTLLEAFS